MRNADTRITQDYFKGINYLLNEQPDKAIEVFLEVLRVDDETVETHFALANLFRRRGEVDRAIHIHQNLIARPNLEPEQRYLALLELGIDYMRAGVLDRAERLFKQLLEAGQHHRQVLGYLIDIYQQEQEWPKAVASVLRLQEISGRNYDGIHAHLLCEQAEQCLADNDVEHARELLDRALQIDRLGPRANLLHARVAMTNHDFAGAIRYFQRVSEQDRELLSETIEPLRTCYQALGREADLADYLHEQVGKHAGISPVLALAQLRAECGDLDQSIEVLSDEMKTAPSMKLMERLLEYRMQQPANSGNETLALVRDCARRLLQNTENYKCRNCGFVGRSLHWQCPGCKSWSTIKPIHGTEGRV